MSKIKDYFMTSQTSSYKVNNFIFLAVKQLKKNSMIYFKKLIILNKVKFNQIIILTTVYFITFNILIYLPIVSGLLMLISLLSVVLAAAYISLNERHIVAIIQRRVGPSITGGSFVLLQPLIDGLKLLLKDLMHPNKSNKF